MIADFLEYFKTNKYDDKILLKNNGCKYSVKMVKEIVFSKLLRLRQISNPNIGLIDKNKLNFILNFLACVFAKKNIYLYNDNYKLNNSSTYTVFDDKELTVSKYYEFDVINPDEISIFFLTSGTTSKNKQIRKTLQNLLNESHDLIKELNFKQNLEYTTTTSLNHLFGMTFYFMLPLNSGGIINTEEISYPEDIICNNSVFISTPSFLEQIKKSDCICGHKFCYIISAGSKLDSIIFDFAKTLVTQNVIDIYGSTEAGVIAYRTDTNDTEMKLFGGVKILETNDSYTKIRTDYSPNEFEILGDKITQNNGKIKLFGRKDNILKIHEKRISATDLEMEICKNEYINDAVCLAISDRIVCMAALNEKGISFIKENSIPEIIKLLNRELNRKFEQIPRKWKFINSLPKTTTGKFDKSKIERFFNLNISLPLITQQSYRENEVSFSLYFYEHCNFFKGHFEKFPILPGVAQLFFACIFTDFAFDVQCFGGQYKKIKFSQIIRPNEEIELKLTKKDNGIRYSYQKDGVVLSSGELPYKNIYKGGNNEFSI